MVTSILVVVALEARVLYHKKRGVKIAPVVLAADGRRTYNRLILLGGSSELFNGMVLRSVVVVQIVVGLDTQYSQGQTIEG